MAVLVDAISVVIRSDKAVAAFAVIVGRFQGKTVPKSSLCADGELVRVGVMTPEDAEQYVKKLRPTALIISKMSEQHDIVVVTQHSGR